MSGPGLAKECRVDSKEPRTKRTRDESDQPAADVKTPRLTARTVPSRRPARETAKQGVKVMTLHRHMTTNQTRESVNRNYPPHTLHAVHSFHNTYNRHPLPSPITDQLTLTFAMGQTGPTGTHATLGVVLRRPTAGLVHPNRELEHRGEELGSPPRELKHQASVKPIP